MAPIIDMSNVEDMDFEPVPAGRYEVALTDWEYIEESDSSGEPYVKLELTIQEGEHENRKLFLNHSAQEKALWALKRTLVAFGASKEDVSGVWDTDEVIPDLVGNTALATVKQREYEGDKTNQVTRVKPIA